MSSEDESSKPSPARSLFKDIAPTTVAIVALVLSFVTANIERASRKQDLERTSNLQIEREIRLQKRLVMLKMLHAANTCNRDCHLVAYLGTSPQSSEFRLATQNLKKDIEALEDIGVEVDAALPKSVADLVKPVWMAMETVLSHANRLMDPTAKPVPDLGADDKKVIEQYATLIAEVRRQLGADSDENKPN